MALSVVQAVSAEVTTGAAVTATATTTSGNLLVVFVSQNVDITNTLTMSAAGGTPTWTQTTSGYSNEGTGRRSAMFYAMNAPSVTSVTGTWSGSISGRINIVLYEVSGAATSSAEDSSVNSNTTTGTSLASGSLTTTNANDILLFGVAIQAAQSADTPGSGFTFQSGSTGGGRMNMDYQIVSATQSSLTTTTSWTASSGASQGVFGAFKAAGVAFQPDEDFWAVGPPQTTPPIYNLSQLMAMGTNQYDEVMVPLFTGQPDEDYWTVWLIQPSVSNITLFS